ncbi:MAG: T9SS type A sorting domain-containing protein, partial [Ignavibacteria bacterium]|nr:T9SS type A sorting domain-containing protein [Ignavibacteria bacterium]
VFPNPSNAQISLQLNTLKRGIVRIELWNILGEKITEIMNQYLEPGEKIFMINLNSYQLPTGVYILVLSERNQNFQFTKFLLLK